MLKNILVNCTSLSFTVAYAHVKARQDDTEVFSALPRPAQLNVHCDGMAKNIIWGFSGDSLPKQTCFPLEPISVWVGEDKMTSDTSKLLKFLVHKQLAEQTFFQLGLMSAEHFQEVAWKQVYKALHNVPRMFQIWVCKQVANIAGVNSNQAVYTPNHNPMCPSCNEEEETCRHVLCCDEDGRVKALNCTINLLDIWLRTVGTDGPLRSCLIE